MNICNYIENLNALYGTVIINLRTYNSYYGYPEETFYMNVDMMYTMWLGIGKWNFEYDSEKVYFSIDVERYSTYLYKRVVPDYHNLYIWTV